MLKLSQDDCFDEEYYGSFDGMCSDDLRDQCAISSENYFAYFSECLLRHCSDDDDRYGDSSFRDVSATR